MPKIFFIELNEEFNLFILDTPNIKDIVGSHGSFQDKEYHLLIEKIISTHKVGRKLIIAMHHSPLSNGSMSRRSMSKFQDAVKLKDYRGVVCCVLYGHEHDFGKKEIDDILYVCCPELTNFSKKKYHIELDLKLQPNELDLEKQPKE